MSRIGLRVLKCSRRMSLEQTVSANHMIDAIRPLPGRIPTAVLASAIIDSVVQEYDDCRIHFPDGILDPHLVYTSRAYPPVGDAYENY
jgi:hypothetical protein